MHFSSGYPSVLAFLAILGFSLSLTACGSDDEGPGASKTLSWTAVSEPSVLGYKLYWGTMSHAYDSNVDVGPTWGSTSGVLACSSKSIPDVCDLGTRILLTFCLTGSCRDCERGPGSASDHANARVARASTAAFVGGTLFESNETLSALQRGNANPEKERASLPIEV